MEAAALQAARFIQGHARDLASLTWESKAPTDFVSEVDLGSLDRVSDPSSPLKDQLVETPLLST